MQKSQKRKQIGVGMDAELLELIKSETKETGVNQSEIVRRSLYEHFDSGRNESAEMMNLILMTAAVQSMKETIPQEEYQLLQDYLNNIMVLKGGR